MNTLKLINKIIDAEIDPAFAKRARFIFKNINAHKPVKVLDIGCGRGYYTKLTSLFPFVKEIQSIDANPEYVKRAKKNVGNDKRITIQTGSIYKLPFKDNYFDSIIASEILEHLDDDKKALKELYRVLKKGGILLVSVPNKNYPFLWDPLNWILERFFNTHIHKDRWWLAGIWADHERLYTQKQLITTVEKQQFSVEDKQEFIRWCWPFTHFMLYAIGKNLVERMGASKFDRFNIDQEKPLSGFIALIVRLPSLLLDKTLPISAFQTLAIVARKR